MRLITLFFVVTPSETVFQFEGYFNLNTKLTEAEIRYRCYPQSATYTEESLRDKLDCDEREVPIIYFLVL